METAFGSLIALHEKLGGSNRIWLGISRDHGWVLLDRTRSQNSPGSRTDKLIFERLENWGDVEIARHKWEAMNGLTHYLRQPLEPHQIQFLIKQLEIWCETSVLREEQLRAKAHLLEVAHEEQRKQNEIERIRDTPHHRRDRQEALLLVRHELKRQQIVERDALDAIIATRNIQFLVHFTAIVNLPSILRTGILPRHKLVSHGVEFQYNDLHRLDDLMEATSLSISFPNYLMLYKLRSQSKNGPYCILALSPRILSELPCMFSERNAACSPISANWELLERYRGVNALAQMFEGGEALKARYGIPPSYTTDPQAEVLVLDDIPTKYISGVVFPRTLDARKRELVTQATAWVAEAGVPDLTDLRREWFRNRADYPARWGSPQAVHGIGPL